MGVNSFPKTVTRQRRSCDLNPGPSAPESSTLTTRLPSHPHKGECFVFQGKGLQKTFWLKGREGRSLPLLRDSHETMAADDDESALGVQTVDE